MWLKFHSRFLCLCPNFKETSKACKSKFSEIFKAYKDDKQANSISWEAHHTNKFYDAIETWYYQNKDVMKHILTPSSDNVDIGCDSEEIKKEEYEETNKYVLSARNVFGNMIYQEKPFELISQLMINSQDMAKSMQVASKFMNNLDKHIEWTN